MKPIRPQIPRLLLSGLALTATTFAQSTSSVPPAGSSRDEAVRLSPFEVTADSDIGYVATKSLAGSRLNAALKDTPAIVDVFNVENVWATVADNPHS